MTDIEKITTVQALVGDDTAKDALISVYLSDAEAAIVGRLYRTYGSVPSGATVPSMY